MILARYIPIAYMGSGASSKVYYAYDLFSKNEDIVIKVYKHVAKDEPEVRMFDVIRDLKHPNIITYYEVE